MMQQEIKCDLCQGKKEIVVTVQGKVGKETCPKCKGTGVLKKGYQVK